MNWNSIIPIAFAARLDNGATEFELWEKVAAQPAGGGGRWELPTGSSHLSIPRSKKELGRA